MTSAPERMAQDRQGELVFFMSVFCSFPLWFGLSGRCLVAGVRSPGTS